MTRAIRQAFPLVLLVIASTQVAAQSITSVPDRFVVFASASGDLVSSATAPVTAGGVRGEWRESLNVIFVVLSAAKDQREHDD